MILPALEEPFRKGLSSKRTCHFVVAQNPFRHIALVPSGGVGEGSTVGVIKVQQYNNYDEVY
jgi:hypothetical protein